MPSRLSQFLWLSILAFACLNTGATAQQNRSAGPAVVAAVAPKWPVLGLGIKKADENASMATVIIDVKIDSAGNVTSATPVKIHPLLVEASLKAARRWRFARGAEDRTAELTFSFIVMNSGARDEELGTVFLPPYGVQITVQLPEGSVLP